MDKPLKDWTLEELSDYCKKVVDPDGNCFNCEAKKYIGLCPFEETAPCDWDFETKPRFTEQEVEDAICLKKFFVNGGKLRIWRGDMAGLFLVWNQAMDSTDYEICSGYFPSIKSGESVTLDDIIGGAE